MNTPLHHEEQSQDEGGETIRVRRGKFVVIPYMTPWWRRKHLLHDERLKDTCERSREAVAVLQSAVLLHGGLLKHVPDQAHVWTPWHRKPLKHAGPSTFDLSRSLRKERLSKRAVVNHRMELDDEHLVVIDGIVTTDIFQTIQMCARFLPSDDAFIAVESLLAIVAGRSNQWREHRGEIERRTHTIITVLQDSLTSFRGQRGVRQARHIFKSASSLSESPFESETKRIAHAAGYLDLESQIEVETALGTKWVDLGIRGISRGLEINGNIKYEGNRGEEQRLREKKRREALNEAGFRIVNLSAHDVLDPRTVLETLHYCYPEQRHLHGRRHLWTPAEARQFCT